MEITLDSIRDIKIYQPRHGYRFSVDALLLYSFVDIPRAARIADLGAGSGIVGLLLAKKYPDAEVILFELQDSLASLARKNIGLNSLEERVTIIKADIRDISSTASYDIVVSNPPFRKERSGLISHDEERAIARHEIRLKLDELVGAADHLLRPKGRFFLIYHPSRLIELMKISEKRGMEIKRLRFVHSSARTDAKMVMIEIVKHGRTGLTIERPFYIYDESGGYSDEMLKVYCIGSV
ncbi:MAG: methyltransferase [Thermodesulfovibrionales bacterium]